ncbi:MAG: hypothetical protein AAFN93_24675, partial [Bacteroidota bacterium]
EAFDSNMEIYKEERDSGLQEFQEEKIAELEEYQSEKDTRLEEYQSEKDTRLEEYQSEKDIRLYGHHLKRFLKQDEYPLELTSLNFLKACIRENNLKKKDIVALEEKLIEPYSQNSLSIYKQAYRSKLNKSFPIEEDESFEMGELRKKLGLEDFDFLQLKSKAIVQELVKPFYQDSIDKYKGIYKSKIKQEGIFLDTTSISNLESIKKSLGLQEYHFDDLNVSKVEQELTKLVHRENFRDYEQKCKQKLEQEGFPFSLAIVDELNRLEETLGLREAQFIDCPNILSLKKKLIEPFYKGNLQPYGNAYKQKLHQFGVSFFQSNADGLEKLRRDFGFDLSYLKNMGLQDLFNLDEISEIEQSLIDSVYRENFKSFEIAFKKKLDKEGFCLNYSTISELSHLEEILGLDSVQIQNFPELGEVKALWVKPFYQLSLQSYCKEYKRKLYQFGLNFLTNNVSELEELRSGFGLTSAHLKNLDIQDTSFQLDIDLFAVEKTANESFYSEVLNHYSESLRGSANANSLFVDQKENLKESLVKLGIKIEDIKVVEGLTKNGWGIE